MNRGRLRRCFDFAGGVPLTWLLSPFAGGARHRAQTARSGTAASRILIIKLAAVGDTVLLVPPVRALRKALPRARIDWLVSSCNVAIASRVPYVDEVITWRGRSISSLAALIRTLRANSYDVVIDAEQWARGTALMSLFTGAEHRVGFWTPGQHRAGLYTQTYRKTFTDHEIRDFFGLFSLVTPLEEDRSLELWEDAAGKAEAAPHLESLSQRTSGEPIILMHPGCGADGLPREWPLESYARLGRLLQDCQGARLVLSGGPEETSKTAELNRLLGGTAQDLAGKLSWPGLITLLRHVDLVISGNTGVMHVAAALRRPQLALHGPTNPRLWGPLSDNALLIQSRCPYCPCLRLGFEYHHYGSACMETIDVQEVLRAATALLERNGSEHPSSGRVVNGT